MMHHTDSEQYAEFCPYQYPECGERYWTEVGLTKHGHCGKNDALSKFWCEVEDCELHPEGHQQRQYMDMHYNEYHRDSDVWAEIAPYSCEKCGMRYREAQGLAAHATKNVTCDPSWKTKAIKCAADCGRCTSSFDDISNLDKHYNRMHLKDPAWVKIA